MAFTNELTGASGSFTAGGTTVNYTASAVGGALDTYGAGYGDIDGTNYWLGNGSESPETYTYTFDQTISGFQINVNAQKAVENIDFLINGIDVNLNTLIANGQVTVVATGNGTINGVGDLVGDDVNVANSTILQFNMPIDTIALATTGSGGNGALVEIRASDALAQDGIVEGTTGNDLINVAHNGDPDGDMVDNNDAILGVADEDAIIGGGGNDTIYGGADDDSIEGDGTLPAGGVSADGNDAIFAEAGNDTVSGGGGADTIDGGTGNDSLSGDNGDDSISGGTGADTLFGGNGSDTLNGDDGDDVINGESGDDLITVGVGDVADGGSAADTFNLDFAQTSTSASSTVAIDGGTSAGSGTDYDTLDLSGLDEFTLTETTDADGDSTSGTAVFDSGQTVSFSEIETF